MNELREKYVDKSVEIKTVGHEMLINITFSSKNEKEHKKLEELITKITQIGARKESVDWPYVSESLEDKEVGQRYHFSLPFSEKDTVMAFIDEALIN